MPGKYSHLKNSLTKFSENDDYQTKVNNEKERIIASLKADGDAVSSANFGFVLVEAKKEKARLEELIKEQNLTIEACTQMLVERMEAEDYTSLKLNGGISLTIKDDVYANVSDKIKFYSWIRETGQEDLFSVHYQTMAALAKNALIEGNEVPPGISTYFKQSITVRGGKNFEQD